MAQLPCKDASSGVLILLFLEVTLWFWAYGSITLQGCLVLILLFLEVTLWSHSKWRRIQKFQTGLNPSFSGSYSLITLQSILIGTKEQVLILLFLEVTLWYWIRISYPQICHRLNPSFSGSYSLIANLLYNWFWIYYRGILTLINTF